MTKEFLISGLLATLIFASLFSIGFYVETKAFVVIPLVYLVSGLNFLMFAVLPLGLWCKLYQRYEALKPDQKNQYLSPVQLQCY